MADTFRGRQRLWIITTLVVFVLVTTILQFRHNYSSTTTPSLQLNAVPSSIAPDLTPHPSVSHVITSPTLAPISPTRAPISPTPAPISKRKGVAVAIPFSIDRIYYINLAKNVKRREFMESWLGQQPIPYERVEAIVGDSTGASCVPKKSRPKQCMGLSGIAMTNLHIMDEYNTTGYTMVLEDDYFINLTAVEKYVRNWVPNDWDVVRFKCWSSPPSTFRHINARTTRTAHEGRTCKAKERCWYCGGNHAALWRESSVPKLREIWSELPYDDIDCRLTTDKINSYIVRMNPKEGYSNNPKGEESDIPKIG